MKFYTNYTWSLDGLGLLDCPTRTVAYLLSPGRSSSLSPSGPSCPRDALTRGSPPRAPLWGSETLLTEGGATNKMTFSHVTDILRGQNPFKTSKFSL